MKHHYDSESFKRETENNHQRKTFWIFTTKLIDNYLPIVSQVHRPQKNQGITVIEGSTFYNTVFRHDPANKETIVIDRHNQNSHESFQWKKKNNNNAYYAEEFRRDIVGTLIDVSCMLRKLVRHPERQEQTGIERRRYDEIGDLSPSSVAVPSHGQVTAVRTENPPPLQKRKRMRNVMTQRRSTDERITSRVPVLSPLHPSVTRCSLLTLFRPSVPFFVIDDGFSPSTSNFDSVHLGE